MRKPWQVLHSLPSRLLITLMSVVSLGLIVSMLISAPKYFLWNASASVPIGLYFVQPRARLQVGDLAVTDLPGDIRALASQRRYLPLGVLLIKPVAAQSGSEVCRRRSKINVNGRMTATAKSEDYLKRPLPIWNGCRHIKDDEVFLMNPVVHDSFDGRYFGPTATHLIRGRAFPLLTFGSSGKQN